MTRSLWDLAATLRGHTWVDLSHQFAAGQPRYPTDPDQDTELWTSVAADGALVWRYRLIGQWGTHVDAPVHFHPGARTLGEIPAAECVAPLAVVDFSAQAAADPDALVTAETLVEWERAHGRVPAGSFVALHTGWAARWDGDMHNDFHYPGWSVTALRLLHERGVCAIGHDVTDADGGRAVARGQLPAQSWWLGQDHWMIESLTNLDRVPATGALVVASWPVPAGQASGFPARVVACLP
ncbi:cyclase family protein [Corynebacterium uberis]|uniref:cyclase family protein n=1 Tax=Corynebacterium TaxID=1716 RepID=UPI001D0AC09A|nr:cyclase family protein [Corynebacterium uberis]MCZ9308793.1 cyclase family protein [Corynebacterium sp. c6VSa_13]UDL72679.1 cyclase family protein [Corynebacterium uberis]UDL76445.1 cyclase family protein [Corynebacterium uberis]UDL78657.1 cyclase family protein [Corynebacterium uberis]UDL80936.1 cyclase family protein [Corynebacterium uberis]